MDSIVFSYLKKITEANKIQSKPDLSYLYKVNDKSNISFFILQVIRTQRPRRNRQWQLAIIFLVYSLMAVLSQETVEDTDFKEDVSSEQSPNDFTLDPSVSSNIVC